MASARTQKILEAAKRIYEKDAEACRSSTQQVGGNVQNNLEKGQESVVVVQKPAIDSGDNYCESSVQEWYAEELENPFVVTTAESGVIYTDKVTDEYQITRPESSYWNVSIINSQGNNPGKHSYNVPTMGTYQ